MRAKLRLIRNFGAREIEERLNRGEEPHLKPIDVYPFTFKYLQSTKIANEPLLYRPKQKEEHNLFCALAHAYQAAGYVISMNAKTSEVPLAIHHYHQMESVARIMNDQTLLNIALAYQGDMYRRLGDISKAIVFLEAARDTTPQANQAARGNGLQLLGRANILNKMELDEALNGPVEQWNIT